MNKRFEHSGYNSFHLRNAHNKTTNTQQEDAFDRARESALLMLAQLFLSKTVAQIKKQ
jgi:hypothetical protein